MPFKAIRDSQTYAILGAAMEVHSCLGCGFPEAPYAEALAREFSDRGVPYRSEVKFEIPYKGKPLKSYYRADFVCYDLVIVELKALPDITHIEEAQAITYLKASGLLRALILNFGSTSLQHRRLVKNLFESA
jgi:GxxExxY protein